MEKIILYKAFDGEKFSTEEECLEHEYKITHLPKAISFWDYDWSEMDIDDIEKRYNSCGYLVIKDIPSREEDCKFMDTYWGFPVMEDTGGIAGTYKYDDYNNKWVQAE